MLDLGIDGDPGNIKCPDRDTALRLGTLLNEYLHARRQVAIRNAEKLAHVTQAMAELYVFERVNRTLKITLSGEGPDGERTTRTVAESIVYIFNMVARDLANSQPDQRSIHAVATTVSNVLKSRHFPLDVKSEILAVESRILAPHYWLWLRPMAMAEVQSLLATRRYTAVSIAVNPTHDVDASSELFDAILHAHQRLYVDGALFPQAMELFSSLLPEVKACPHLVDKILLRLVLLNNLFAVSSKDGINKAIEAWLPFAPPDRIRSVLAANAVTFDKIEVRDLNLKQSDHTLGSANRDTLATHIAFVVPIRFDSAVVLELADGVSLQFSPVKSLMEDPVFHGKRGPCTFRREYWRDTQLSGCWVSG